jgi:phosphoadenosine phosphosulfate reductase
MLTPSQRHRPEDLTMWSELEEADFVNGRRLLRSGKIEQSIDAIRDFEATGPCYASVSWGKDSTVLFDLLARAGFRSPVVWMTYGQATNPECRAVRDMSLTICPGMDYREVDVGEAEDMRDDFGPVNRLVGADRYILGIRADESGIRRMSLRHLGLDTGRACRPLGWWLMPDVFGYLAMRRLPVHPNYAMLGGGRWPREHIRTASIGGKRGDERGRAEWEREYYGDVLNRLSAATRCCPHP